MLLNPLLKVDLALVHGFCRWIHDPTNLPDRLINFGELAKGVAAATGSSESDARKTIAAVFDQIADAATKGEEVAIPGFGKFAVKDRPERDGRNPATGEAIKIAASRKVAFTAAKGLKDKL